MDTSNSVTQPDGQARVRFVFSQQLQTFINLQFSPRDPHERFAERVNALELAYTARPHCLQSDFRENYARKHMHELIEQREEILEKFQAFHEDGEFVTFLKQFHPHLYSFAKWQSVCLALAEKYEAATRDDGTPINEPPKKKLTPEEWRANKVRRQQIRIEDKIALAKARLESLTKARQVLEEFDSQEFGFGGIEQELTADILAPEEEEDSGNFKQL
jgi:hypothetical protein